MSPVSLITSSSRDVTMIFCDVFEKVRSDGVPVCVSGAGPSLLAFESAERSVPDPGGSWRSLRIAVRSAGVEVTSA